MFRHPFSISGVTAFHFTLSLPFQMKLQKIELASLINSVETEITDAWNINLGTIKLVYSP